MLKTSFAVYYTLLIYLCYRGAAIGDTLRKESEESNVSNEVVDVETLTEEKCEWGSCQLIFSTQKVSSSCFQTFHSTFYHSSSGQSEAC